MGATVTTNKAVYSFKDKSEQVAFVLFEETYEKNCYPHTPRYSCVSVGYIDDVLKFIFLAASSCEGGMLQGRNGYIKPENYIKSWINLLKTPSLMQDICNTLKFSDGYRSVLPADEKDFVVKTLSEAGYVSELDKILSAGYVATLYNDFDLIKRIYSVGRIGPWRFIDAKPFNSDYSGYGYDPVICKKQPDSNNPAIRRVDKEDLLIQNSSGYFEHKGWDYSVVGSYIANYWKTEIKHPGSFKRAIADFRQACKDAPQIPNDAIVEFSHISLEHYSIKENHPDFFKSLQFENGVKSISFEQLRDKEKNDKHLIYHILQSRDVKWKIATSNDIQNSLF